MQIGAVFPQTEFGTVPSAIRDYAQTAEELGYTHILAYEHVLGANSDRPGGWQGPYTYKDSFLSPFLLFSYMTAFTTNLGFITGILILPQRQTALAAKQAATLDVLCGGRFRLGVGIGWNQVEYTSLNENFHDRGRRIEEQVSLMRELWTHPLIDFNGRWHHIPDAGINPLPIQKPIPIWFGGSAKPVLRRVAQMGNGWLPNLPKAEDAKPALEIIDKYLEKFGRKRTDIGIEARLRLSTKNPDSWLETIQAWQEEGATHMSINTMGYGLKSLQEHIQELARFAKVIGLKK